MAAKEKKIYKSIPSSETGATLSNFTRVSRNEYLITQCPEKNRFTLWRVLKEGYEKLDTASSPLVFENKIPWDE